MKAVRYTRYGPPEVLTVEEIERPAPVGKQVLVKVRAASINALEWRAMGSNPLLTRMIGGNLKRPKNPRVGTDVAGVVEAVGADVTRFKPGDAVFGCATGAFAEYVLAREANLAIKPERASFEQAAAVPVAGLTALQGLRMEGGIKPGEKVLIQGASGGVGVFAVQLAKYSGGDVTAVVSTRNLEMARSIGADRTIDYTKEDFTRAGECYDLIFAVNGYHSIFAYKRVLNPGGRYICAGGTMGQIFQALLLGPRVSNGEKTLRSMGISNVDAEDLEELASLLDAGVIALVIDKTYPLEETAAAMQYVMGTHPQGKVVIVVE